MQRNHFTFDACWVFCSCCCCCCFHIVWGDSISVICKMSVCSCSIMRRTATNRQKKIKTQRIVSLANIYHTTVGFRRFIWNSAKEKPNIKSPLTTDYWLLQMTASAMDTICYWLIRSISWYWAICYSKRVFDFCSKL